MNQPGLVSQLGMMNQSGLMTQLGMVNQSGMSSFDLFYK